MARSEATNVTHVPRTFEKRIRESTRQTTFCACEEVVREDILPEEQAWRITLGVDGQFYTEEVRFPRSEEQMSLSMNHLGTGEAQKIDVRAIVTMYDRMNMFGLAMPEEWGIDLQAALDLFASFVPPSPRPTSTGRRRS